MKTFIATLLILFIFSLSPKISTCEELGTISLSLVSGNVQIYDRDAEEWTTATINTPITVGDLLSVPEDGRAELRIEGGIFVRLDYSTSLELISLSDTDAHFYLEHGRIYVNNKKGGREIIQIDTPVATCTATDNSISVLDVADNDSTGLSLIKGNAYLETGQGKTMVTAGNSLKVDNYGAELSPIDEPDDFESWNQQQDAAEQKLGESARYLPEELHEYSNDFDKNGNWTFVREYGYVWTPTVVSFEWVPFRLGQWIWVRNDYVWVPEERWGWAPSHFGRWAHINGIGWSWVPPRAGSVAWGPGSVAWVQTSSTIGWVPLAPGEIYYGRRSYGSGTAALPARNFAGPAPVYRNEKINNAVTVISVNLFNQRNKQRTFIRNENPFRNNKSPVTIIAPPARKPRIDAPLRPALPPTAAGKPTMHPLQQNRGILPPANGAVQDHQTKTPETIKALPHVASPGRENGAKAPSINKETPTVSIIKVPPLRQQLKPVDQQPASNRAIQQNKTDQNPGRINQPKNENRGQRPLVRDSGQSAFRKEQPRQLPLKKLDEPKKTPQKQREQPKRVENSNTNSNSDGRGPTKGIPKAKSDKP